jgi:NAD(P)-dependent dehydrogenase (short-subunit alcohol dehydrogenase family)
MFDAHVELAGIDREEAARMWPRDQLIERLIRPEEVSNAVMWLASEWASAITGVALPVDGGLVERTTPADTSYLGTAASSETASTGS